MKDIFDSGYVSRILSARAKRRRIIYIMLILSVITAVLVFRTLRGTGIAMTDEFLCGRTEHTHSAECLSDINGCGLEEHVHSAECVSDISADFETEEVWINTLPDGLSGNIRENMAAIALSQTGYRESERNFTVNDLGEKKGYTRYGQWYGNPYGDWNTMFVYFCMYYSGISTEDIPYGSGCTAWTENLAEKGLLMPPDCADIAPGDVFFLDSDNDGNADRAAVATEFFDAEYGMAMYAAEGDTDNEAALNSYYLADERITGWLTLGDIYVTGEASAVLPNAVTYLAGTDSYMKVNGTTVYPNDKTTRIKANSSKPVIVESRLDKYSAGGEYNKYAFFVETDKATYEAGRAETIKKTGVGFWQYFKYEGKTEDENRYFFTYANMWISAYYPGKPDNEKNVDCGYQAHNYTFDPDTETVLYTFTITPKDISWGGEPYNIDVFYNHCIVKKATPKPTETTAPTEATDPTEADPDPPTEETLPQEEDYNPLIEIVPPEINILTNNEGANKHQTIDKAYEIRSGGTLDIKAAVKLSECSVSVEENYKPTAAEKNDGMTVIRLSDGRTVGLYARFENYGFSDPKDMNDTRVKPQTDYNLTDNDTLEITYHIDITNHIKDYRYNVIEFYPGKGTADAEQLWLDIQPAESLGTLNMIKAPGIGDCCISYTEHQSDNPFPMEARKSVTLEGTTNHFEYINENEYKALPTAQQKEYMRIANADGSNSYLKTRAAFWAYDYDTGGNADIKESALKRESIVYELPGDGLLHIKITYTANENDTDIKTVVSFFDGTPVSSDQEWRFYKGIHIKVNKFDYNQRLVYVKTENGWREKNMINEWFPDLPNEILHSNGYILNSKDRPYILYPGDELYIYVITESEDGSIECTAGNEFVINGESLHILNDIEEYPDSTIVPGKTVKVKGFKAIDYLPYNTAEDGPTQDVWDDTQKKLVTLPDGSYIVEINYIDPNIDPENNNDDDSDSDFYVKVMPSKKGSVECADYLMDHCDIEIADGGIYEFIRDVIMPDGSRREIHEIYDSMVSGVHSCDLYSDKAGTQRVRQYLGYDKSTGEPIYGDETVQFAETDYVNIGDAGSTQFEFTSKYRNEKHKNNDDTDNDDTEDIFFQCSDVKNVKFVVQLTLIPSVKKIVYYDSENQFVKSSADVFNGTSLVMENIEIEMTGQSIIDALNKCPNHSGLDFTFVKPIKTLTTVKAGSAVIKADKKLLKTDPDDISKDKGNYPLKEGQFTFKIIDTKNDDDPSNDEVFYATNDKDGNIVFPEFSYAVEGDYKYIISEVIPEDKSGSILYDEETFTVNVTVTYNDGEHDSNDDRQFEVECRYESTPEFVNRYVTYELPMTGGRGTIMFFAAGGTITAAALALLLRRKNPDERN